MPDGERKPRLTEPEVVHCILCEGVTIEVRDEIVRLVGWIDLETVEYAEPERRIVARAALPLLVARALIRDLRRAVARGGN